MAGIPPTASTSFWASDGEELCLARIAMRSATGIVGVDAALLEKKRRQTHRTEKHHPRR